jgi:hypothetical protein
MVWQLRLVRVVVDVDVRRLCEAGDEGAGIEVAGVDDGLVASSRWCRLAIGYTYKR